MMIPLKHKQTDALQRRCARLLPCVVMAMALLFSVTPAHAQSVDCDEIYDIKPSDTYTIKPSDITACIHRGWDPPAGWRKNQGVNSGVNVGGAKGFSYGVVNAPEASPGRMGARASASVQAMDASCKFPPRVKVKFPLKVSFPKGSCWDLAHQILKDYKNRKKNPNDPPPPGVSPSDSCPEESDTTGLFGVKRPLQAGQQMPLTCGGMMPTTTSSLILNPNPTYLAITKQGDFNVAIYRNTGNGFALVTKKRLPTYLCAGRQLDNPGPNDDDITFEKAIDLTPPLAQMITFDGGGELAIRLQSRASMNPEFKPPFDYEEPEKYLTIPLEAGGNFEIPEQSSCPRASIYYNVPQMRQDIRIEPSFSTSCVGLSLGATDQNEPILKCPAGATLTQGECRDDNGQKVQGRYEDNWVKKCPENAVADADGKCPQDAGIPPEGRCTGFDVEATIATCEKVTRNVDGEACKGQLQYAVLNRPNLYYPPGTTTTVYPIEGETAFMATTTSDSRYYAQSQVTFHLQQTAPAITFPDGGFLSLADGTSLVMSPPATVDIPAGRVIMTGGGKHVSAGGTRLASIPSKGTFVLPANNVVWPLEMRTGRSVMIPKGYMIPTMPSAGAKVPYIRLPMTPPPRE
jgi:hypothetical protein